MIAYNPKHWFRLIVEFHKGDSFRKLLPALVAISAYAVLVVFIMHRIGWGLQNSTAVHSILGFVLSMMLVFRTNTAYDRWWEGRKIWGSLVNNSRNLALKLATFVPREHQAELKDMQLLIGNYNYCLKNHLRDIYKAEELDETASLSKQELSAAAHKPNRIAAAMYANIQRLYKKNIIAGDQLIVLNEELKSFTDNCGACERIKNTPIPYSYSKFLKQLVFIYVMTLPIMFGIEFKYAIAPITVMVLYVFASIELIAEEIEDPFGRDENDLPTGEICAKIKTNLHEIFEL